MQSGLKSGPLKTSLLGLATLAALGLAAAATAQGTTYTLTGVTFYDGAIATGTLDFDPATGAVGTYDITTTDGVSDGLPGAEYTNSDGTGSFQNSYFLFDDASSGPDADLLLSVNSPANPDGSYTLAPGYQDPNLGAPDGSFEQTYSNNYQVRYISGGSLTPATVPEPSSVAAFAFTGLFAAALVLRARKRRAVA